MSQTSGEHETKVVVVVRDDLEVWQKLNVTAFLMSGVATENLEMMGKPYLDVDGNHFMALSVQPIIVLSASVATLTKIHDRALSREISTAVFIDEMFQTSNDNDNRAAFSAFNRQTAKITGIALRAPRALADKIVKGASIRH